MLDSGRARLVSKPIGHHHTFPEVLQLSELDASPQIYFLHIQVFPSDQKHKEKFLVRFIAELPRYATR
jgi:hypothetical protein